MNFSVFVQILGGNPLDRMGHQRLPENKHTPLRWAVASRKILLLHSLLTVLRACTLIMHCWVLALTMVDNHWWWLSHSWSYVEILKTGVFSAGRVIKYPPTVVLLLCSSADRRVSCFWALVKLSLRYIVVEKSKEGLPTHSQFLQTKTARRKLSKLWRRSIKYRQTISDMVFLTWHDNKKSQIKIQWLFPSKTLIKTQTELKELWIGT